MLVGVESFGVDVLNFFLLGLWMYIFVMGPIRGASDCEGCRADS